MITISPWANEDALYQKMLSYMPNLYFLTDLSDSEVSRLCSMEFLRIRGLLCRYNRFDEEKYINENDGESPFDMVRADVEKEIRSRIRINENLRILLSLRSTLLKIIADTVRSHSNFIDTYYVEEGRDAEYKDSPIVVTEDDSAFNRYGGYEAATLYNLQISDDVVICTLNGEGGENFELPITTVQTDSLIVIVQWLEEYGFIASEKPDTIVCEECGSTEIQTQAWVDANTHEYIDETGIDRDDNWCNGCQTNTYFCSKTEFIERMEAWWGDADFSTMERVTGYRQDDFSPEEGYQDFVDACNKWWKAKSYDEKRAIFKEQSSEE